jgi:hypothetical protein
LYLKDSIALGEGRGNAFIVFLKRGRQEIAVEAGNSRKDPGTSEETIPEGQTGANCESHWKKMTCLHGAFRRRQVGKPCLPAGRRIRGRSLTEGKQTERTVHPVE